MQDLFSFGTGEGFNSIVILINLVLSFGLSYLIAIIYKTTHKGLSYSQAFTQTIVVLGVIATAATMVIGSSLARAFGLAGALSIIRFRTVIKDPKDIAYVFWSLVVGLACGSRAYPVAIITTLILAIIVFLLFKINFGSIRKHDYILRYYQDADAVTNEDVQQLLQTYFKYIILLTMNAHKGGKTFEFSYNVHFIDEKESDNLLKELSSLKGISNVYILRATSDVDY